jgi:ElaA protein
MKTVNLFWELKSFEELNSFELYKILKLRSQVFVVEQNCVFLDMDDKDQYSHHLMGWNNKDLAAYSRLIAPGKVYKQMTIGRVVTSPNYRKTGAGKELITVSIKKCYELFGKEEIKIGAQLYLKKFYSSFGFIQSCDIYDEDGIEHIEMIK